LFIFEELGKPVFQTREMKFPLDIIWINDNVIVDISKEAVPTTTRLYYSQEMVDKVLEVKAGFINKNDIKIKDKITN